MNQKKTNKQKQTNTDHVLTSSIGGMVYGDMLLICFPSFIFILKLKSDIELKKWAHNKMICI